MASTCRSKRQASTPSNSDEAPRRTAQPYASTKRVQDNLQLPQGTKPRRRKTSKAPRRSNTLIPSINIDCEVPEPSSPYLCMSLMNLLISSPDNIPVYYLCSIEFNP